LMSIAAAAREGEVSMSASAVTDTVVARALLAV
jgi:hypothetical protein